MAKKRVVTRSYVNSPAPAAASSSKVARAAMELEVATLKVATTTMAAAFGSHPRPPLSKASKRLLRRMEKRAELIERRRRDRALFPVIAGAYLARAYWQREYGTWPPLNWAPVSLSEWSPWWR